MLFLRRVYVAHRALRAHYVTVALTLFHSLSPWGVVFGEHLRALRLWAEVLILLWICVGSYRRCFCSCFLCFLLFPKQLKLSNFFLLSLSLLPELLRFGSLPLFLFLTLSMLLLRLLQFYLKLLLLLHLYLLCRFVRWTGRTQRRLLRHSDLFCDCCRPLIVGFRIILVGQLRLGRMWFLRRGIWRDIWFVLGTSVVIEGIWIRLRCRAINWLCFNLFLFRASSSHFKFKIIK